MLVEILILFIILTILMFVFSIYTIYDNPYLSLPFIFLGMIFSVLCTYGMFDVEFFYVGYNASNGSSTSMLHDTSVYGDPYGYIFMFIFFVFVILFFVAGFQSWKQALKQEGEMDMKTKYRRF